MTDETSAGKQQSMPVPAGRPLQGHLSIDSPSAGKKALREDFNYWTGHITQSSIHLGFAVIAANWATFQSVDGVLGSIWAKLSLASVLLSFCIGLLGADLLAAALRKRFNYADAEQDAWQEEFNHANESNSRWPYTEGIELASSIIRRARMWLPVIGGAFYLFAIILR